MSAMKGVITDYSRMHSRTGFKLGGMVGHVTRHVTTVQGQKVQRQGHKVT